MTALQASDTVFGLFSYANESTGQILFGLFMIGIFFIMLLSMKKLAFEYAIFAASGISFLLSALLAYTGLLNFSIPLVFLIVLALSGMYVYVVSR